MSGNEALTIGRLARAAGVHVETVRYYERRGLIEQPAKPAQGHRAYSRATLERLLFIKRAQELGFTLQEIAGLLALGGRQCAEVQAMAAEKLAAVEAKIADLQRLQAVLDRLVRSCKANRSHGPCPIVETLLPDA
ncbi:Hg(II)-responsive transcriptional regulator [Microbulbifer sp. HZ11]|uniref:Hg(II)-responsive transcriptional regulator n=1 Tax=Microbulbifer sp. HZ11 TaxID=1453501 RepID=UPI0005B9EFB0|nr:Hg(II)-responsive transcriptional regulator [Microbulbifer sp. HZ11]